MSQTSRRIIVWDIDHTLLDSSLEQTFFRFIRTHGYHSWWRTSLSTLRLLLTLTPLLHRWRLSYIRGMTTEKINGIAQECFDKAIRSMLRRELIEAIRAFNSEDVQQILMTGAPDFLAVPLAEYVGIEEVIAGLPEKIDGKYTGRLEKPQPYSRRKVIALEEWLRSNDYEWQQVTAIADSWADRHLLRRVGRAVVVHPGSRLGKEALRRGWRVVRLPSKVEYVVSLIRTEI